MREYRKVGEEERDEGKCLCRKTTSSNMGQTVGTRLVTPRSTPTEMPISRISVALFPHHTPCHDKVAAITLMLLGATPFSSDNACHKSFVSSFVWLPYLDPPSLLHVQAAIDNLDIQDNARLVGLDGNNVGLLTLVTGHVIQSLPLNIPAAR